MHVWNHEAYWQWYKYIEYDANDKTIRIKAEVEVNIEGWDTQWFKGLIASDRKLELDK